VLRDLQPHLNRSALFAPWLKVERIRLSSDPDFQRKQKKKSRQGYDTTIGVKVGHGGTLDPLATGVLITGVGKGTKQMQGFLECTKSYEAIVLFGVATDSYDRLGKVVKRADYAHITREKVEEALGRFRGKTMQTPPVFSALRIDGKRLYEYAREGKELPRDIERRPVDVSELEVVEWWDSGEHDHKWPAEEVQGVEKEVAEKLFKKSEEAMQQTTSILLETDKSNSKRKRDTLLDQADDCITPVSPSARKKTKAAPEDTDDPVMSGALPAEEDPSSASVTSVDISSQGPPACKIRMTVTSGFYVRSLCHDLGLAVGSLGLMSELVRTRQGEFELGRNVLRYEDLEKGEDVWRPQVEKMLEEWNEKNTEPNEKAEIPKNRQEKQYNKQQPRRPERREKIERKTRRNSSSPEAG